MTDIRTTDGVRLHIRDTGGAGVPLVLLHGWSQSQAMFRHQLDGLDGRRVISFDMRGHGDSDKPDYGYRIARLAADLRDVLQALDLDSVDLLGWSMGASVIWSYLELFGQEKVRSLILVDQPAAVVAQPWMTSAEQRAAGSILPVEGLGALAAAISDEEEGEATVRAFVRGMFSGPVEEDLWTFIMAEVQKTPRRVAAPLLFDHGAQDWRGLVPFINVPTLVIGCDGSHVSPDSQRDVAARIPGARAHIFPWEVASSHFPFLQNPVAFNAVVSDFLDQDVSAPVPTSVQSTDDNSSERAHVSRF